LSRLDWLEEAWYSWVIADDLTWDRYYDKATTYVKRSLRWLKRILQSPSRSKEFGEYVEPLVKEIEPIEAVDALNEGRVLGLTPKFRLTFFDLLAKCVAEEVQAGSTFKPPQ
jgi:hypothetical protein